MSALGHVWTAPWQAGHIAPDGVGSLLCIRSPRLQSNWGILHNIDSDQATLTSIFFAAICASGFFGSVTVSTPFLKLASILSVSTPFGTWKERSNEPKFRSRR